MTVGDGPWQRARPRLNVWRQTLPSVGTLTGRPTFLDPETLRPLSEGTDKRRELLIMGDWFQTNNAQGTSNTELGRQTPESQLSGEDCWAEASFWANNGWPSLHQIAVLFHRIPRTTVFIALPHDLCRRGGRSVGRTSHSLHSFQFVTSSLLLNLWLSTR